MTQRIRSVTVWSPELDVSERPDGSILIAQRGPLEGYPLRLSDRIKYWAEGSPERTWMADRGEDGIWSRITYAELLALCRQIGSFLLTLGLSADRPVLILSENSLEHAVIALSAQYVGVPSCAIAPAYSLTAIDHEKLRGVVSQITPGALFAKGADRFEDALEAVFDVSIPIIYAGAYSAQSARPRFAWSEILSGRFDADPEAAQVLTGPETIAKFLFTSGSTGKPKAVIQTQRMLCANMEMVRDCFRYVRDQPPILLDWAPWNHVASGNMVFNFALYNGGTYYIDRGRPTPEGIEQTIRNLGEVSPTWYFNVPLGFDLLCERMEAEPDVAASFFRELKIIMYAGAGMATHTWRRLEALSLKTVGMRILMCTGLGATETAPFALFCTEPQSGPGNIGVPMKGLEVKLVPTAGKLELRIKGPSVTPGYWREPELTARAFDEDGFYNMGDAVKPADAHDLRRGLVFDGRTAENFKLDTGTWVAVGALRANLVDATEGLVRDAVICGENRSELGALLVPARERVELLVEGGRDLPDADLFQHPAFQQRLSTLLNVLAQRSTGSSNRIRRAAVLHPPPDPARGEMTEKGSLNQRVLMANRQVSVEELYRGGPHVIVTRRASQDTQPSK